MDKEHILAEIRRTAAANGGVPLGKERFAQQTGIRLADWYGRHWARWGDALQEAGFKPNELQGAYPDDFLIEKVIEVTRELSRLPVYADFRMKAAREKSFPSHGVFHRLGSKRQLVAKVLAYCQARSGFGDVIALCIPAAGATEVPESRERLSAPEVVGFVYLLKAGKYYKVGRTNAVGRRERELAIQLPDKANTIHSIRTDDPAGIEAYWHRRFEPRRLNGEWFALTAADVLAFRRRKFM
ncbi:MAG: GIY-YIG nuclease family protein [Thermoanaerobaculia bacterium]